MSEASQAHVSGQVHRDVLAEGGVHRRGHVAFIRNDNFQPQVNFYSRRWTNKCHFRN